MYTIVQKLSELIDNANSIKSALCLFNKNINANNREKVVTDAKVMVNNWANLCRAFLKENELFLECLEFDNLQSSPRGIDGFNGHLNNLYFYVADRIELLIQQQKKKEDKLAKVEYMKIYIDDIDNFNALKNITSNEVIDYGNSAFLEDDVEEAFLKLLGEPYKEFDSGAETRDLFTDRIYVNSKRLSTAIMFKGRGVKSELTIKHCGHNGDQLLKLAKNSDAQCFIVQHVHKIGTDVREALIDHVISRTPHSKVYICFIDGIDTARLLKSAGYNLEELKAKKG